MTAEDVRRYFRLTHELLDVDEASPAPRRTHFLELVLRQLPPAATVVELGCGSGRPVMDRLTAAGHTVVGVDIVRPRLAEAQRTITGAHVIEADFTTVAFPTGRLHAVLAFYGLIHAPALALGPVIGRCASWLRPGGYLAASVGSACSLWRAGASPTTASCIPEPQLLAMLGAAGLVAEEHEQVRHASETGSVSFTFVLARKPAVPTGGTGAV